MDMLIPFLITVIAAVMIYIQTVCEEEQRRNKHIPLIWEKEFWK